MTRCACGAATEGEPFHNGWVRHTRIPYTPEPVCRAWECPACHAADIKPALLWSFADAVEHEDNLP